MDINLITVCLWLIILEFLTVEQNACLYIKKY